MATTDVSGLVVPQEIAQAIMHPSSYLDLEGIVVPAGEWLQQNMPIGRAQIDGYDPVWLISRHADIQDIARNNVLFHNGDCNPHLGSRADDDFVRELTGGSTRSMESFSYMDPPEHTGYRGAVNEYFKAGAVRRKYEELFTALAHELVDEFMDFDGECDFVADFAAKYPTRVTMAILGVPPEDHLKMLMLTKEFFGGHDPSMQRQEFRGLPDAHARQWSATVHEFYGFFQELRDRRGDDPRDDLTTYVNGLEVDGEPWPDRIKNGFLATVAPAGIDTTVSAIAGSILAFTRQPEQLALAKSDPELLPGLVDESIRWTTPAKHFMRNTVEDTVFNGVPMRAMDRQFLMLFSGNRDPGVFPDPHRFDITRRPNRQLSFSFGPHMCLGQHIARTEMRILFGALLPRLRSIEVVGEPEREQSNLVSNWRTMPVCFTKA